MYRLGQLALVIAIGLSCAGLLWWVGDTLDHNNRARSNPTTIIAPADTAASRTHSTPASTEVTRIDLDLASAQLRVAAVLLTLLTGVIAVLMWRSRSQRAVRSPVSATTTDYQLAARLAALADQVAAQRHQLEATHTAVANIAANTHAPDSARRPTEERTRSLFLSQMSHELRTPLHGILGHAQNLRRDSLTHLGGHTGLEAIERSGQQLLGVINDLIDLARLEDGQLALTRQPCDLQQLVGEASKAVQPHAAEKGIVLNIETSPAPLPWVFSDGPRLRQLMTRLTDSAIACAAVEKGGRGALNLTLRFGDTGLSIVGTRRGGRHARQSAGNESLAVDCSRASPDTSLAFSVGSRLVSLFGGEMLRDVASGDFSARIPCDAAVRPAAPGIAQPAALPAGLHCRLMLVDTEATDRTLFADLLASPNCAVEGEASIERARQRLHDQAFDLVLLDIGEPDQTAQENASELRLVAAGQPKVVALCNGGLSQAARHAEQAGFDAVLTKPIDPGQLMATLGALLELPAATSLGQHAQSSHAVETPWPQPLGRETATKIYAALDRGDIDSLFALADELAVHSDAPPSDVQTLGLLARLFDFAALRRLAEQLGAGPTDGPVDA